jgi:CelD/BcsL family acetyltransferase involved in cellulose biosynthesis
MSDISLYRRFEDIAEPQWSELLAHSADATVFQQYAWVRAWWNSFQQPDWSLHLLCASEGGTLMGLAPLYSRPGRFGGRELRLLGEGHSDYLLFPIRRGAEATAAQLLSAMAVVIDEGCNALLNDVLEGSVLHKALQLQMQRNTTPEQLSLHCVHRTPCPQFVLAGNTDAVQAATRKQSLRRHQRSLATVGPITIEHHSTAAAILPLLPQLFALHIDRWSGTATPSQFDHLAERRFYEDLVRTLPSGTVWLTTLHAGRELAALHLGLLSNRDFIWYKPAFEKVLQRHGPGEVLLQALLQHVHAQGIQTFDFARGDDAYKQRFATRTAWTSSYEWISERWTQRGWQRLRLAVRKLRALRRKQ